MLTGGQDAHKPNPRQPSDMAEGPNAGKHESEDSSHCHKDSSAYPMRGDSVQTDGETEHP